MEATLTDMCDTLVQQIRTAPIASLYSGTRYRIYRRGNRRIVSNGQYVSLQKRWFMIWWRIAYTLDNGTAIRLYNAIDERLNKHRESVFAQALREIAPPPDNLAFEEYKAETLRHLDDEQRAFSNFLQGLRRTKDKEEFEAFLAQKSTTRQPV